MASDDDFNAKDDAEIRWVSDLRNASPPIPDTTAKPIANSPQKGFTKTAWVVITLLVAFIVGVPMVLPKPKDELGDGSASLTILELQGKYLVGVAELPGARPDDIYQQADALNSGPLVNRLCYVVLAGELKGAEEATSQLENVDDLLDENDVEPRAKLRTVISVLNRLYHDYQRQQWQAPNLSSDDRQLLRAELGWYGELALAPREGPSTAERTAVVHAAQRTMAVFLVFFIVGLIAGLAGLAGAVLFAVLAIRGQLRLRVQAASGFGGVYAETFAIWMLLFVALSILAELVEWGSARLLVSAVISLATASALFWPLLRGVTWAQLRRDLGLTGGKYLLEPLWGAACYVCTLPLLGLGVLLMIVLISIFGAATGTAGGNDFGSPDAPSHPIIQWIRDGGPAVWVQVLLLACVAAPLLEETMFRGVLYRHLRDCSAGWRVLVSVLFSAGLNSFVFAVIHPQGILAVPPLTMLAFGFSLTREWRGSLIAPMTMHAINNGIVTALLILTMQ